MTAPPEAPKGLGFIGLGNMGAPMAANIAGGGFQLTVYDKAGSAARAPAGTLAVESLAALAAKCETVFLSVPDGRASLEIAERIIALRDHTVTAVIDFSTIGIDAAKTVHQRLADAGISYIDAPVSGGQSGARAATITLIWAGSAALLDRHRSVLRAMAKNIFAVGEQAGQGQAMKILNNFLSATALLATSEAILFGQSQGLDMATMLEVLNVSTGRNTATSDKFPNRILSKTFDAGFFSALMSKDVQLYKHSAQDAGTPLALGSVVDEQWRRMSGELPGSDISEIFNWLSRSATAESEPR